MSLSQWMPGEAPREKLLERGVQALSDAELLAVMLRTGYQDCDALGLARALLHEFGGLSGLIRADSQRLLDMRGLGKAKYAQLLAAYEIGRRQALQVVRATDALNCPSATLHFLQHHLGARTREVFSCLFLDSQHRLICCEDMFFGTLDGAAVYPREVAVRALQNRAAAVIFAHNHPSGVAEPSTADRRITKRLQAALELLDIRVLDHVIVGRGEAFSFAQAGLL
ncbi:MAG: DNA repair protein RadC [Pseudomonadota bacterium]